MSDLSSWQIISSIIAIGALLEIGRWIATGWANIFTVLWKGLKKGCQQ